MIKDQICPLETTIFSQATRGGQTNTMWSAYSIDISPLMYASVRQYSAPKICTTALETFGYFLYPVCGTRTVYACQNVGMEINMISTKAFIKTNMETLGW